jgi:hypothetical protein
MRACSEVRELVGEILASAKAKGSRELAAWRHPERDIRRLARRDYAPSVRKLLGQDALQEVIHSARRIFPSLNREHEPMQIDQWLKETPAQCLDGLFARVTNRLDVHFQGSPFTGPEGLALRGFFLSRDNEALKRPLIYVNTAHHPVAVAATFLHEIGHLVASEIFDRRGRQVHLFFDADYLSHLDDVEELVADIVLSLMAYPAPVARKIFGVPWKWGVLANATELSDEVFRQVSDYFHTRFGISLGAADIPARRKLNYLGGMIHFAKLRATLLAEYRV